MPDKLQFYAQLAEQTALRLTGSLQTWMSFLDTAARLYKYPYHEQLLIFAQRPDATACADYELWNNTMHRYVRRGSQGIALLNTDGDRPRLRYVFDVADTGGGKQSRRPYLWEYRDEHYDTVSAALEKRFGIAPGNDLAEQLEEIASLLVNEYWSDNQYDILGIVDGSFLGEYDDFNIGAEFRSAAAVSTTYTLLSRCGLEAESYFTPEDYLNVFDFNTPAAVAALGTAVSQSSEQVLRQIEVDIKNYEREKHAERSQSHDGADLSEERRLHDPQPDAERAGADAPGQVREDAQEVSPGASPGAVESDDSERNAVPAPAGDRRGSEQSAGADDPGAGENGRGDGAVEGPESDGLGGTDEQLQSPGGGNRTEGVDLQLSQVDGGQFSLFPSEREQIDQIAEAESVQQAPSAFSIFQEDIDHFLRVGSNTEDARSRIALEYMKQKPMTRLTAFVKQTFHDGYGLQTNNGRFASWAAEDGLHIAKGSSARYDRTAQILSWEDAAARIGELLEQGQFAANVELIEAPAYERRQAAESLWYLSGDMSAAAHEGGWLPILRENNHGGFPEATERLTKLLEDTSSRQIIMEQLAAFTQAWREDASLMRFRHYRPDVMLERVAELGIARREYPEGMAELPAQQSFITEDEIDATLSRGVSYDGAAGRIYAYWQQAHTPKEKADFLKNQYGTGGGNNAISHNFHSWEDHSAKGITLRKPFSEDVTLSWAKAAKRIDAMIAKDRYLTPEAKAEWEKAQAENEARSAADNEYNAIKEADDPSPPPQRRAITREDIDRAIQAWNGDIKSKHTVVRHMEKHGREKQTAEWLAREFNATTDPFHISVDGAEMDFPWSKVQRRIAQLIKAERFYTQEEYDNLDDVDPIAIRERLESPEPSPFVQQVMADAERIAQEEQAATPAQPPVAAPKRPGQTRVERNYRSFARQFPEIVSGEYRYLELRSGEGSGLMPLTIQRIGEDEIAVAHTYEQNGDLMYDPEMTFHLDTERGTLEPLTFRQDGGLPLYQEVYPEPDRWNPKLRNDLSAFAEQWLKNIEMQGRVRTRAIAVLGGEDVELSFDEKGQTIHSGETAEQASVPAPEGSEADAVFAAENMIPGETTFTLNGRIYQIDQLDLEHGTVQYQDISFIPPQDGKLFYTEPISVVRWYLEAEQAQQPEHTLPIVPARPAQASERELAGRLHAFFKATEPEEYERQLAAGKTDADLIAETAAQLNDTLYITETLSQMELIVAEESFGAEQMAEVNWLTNALKKRLPENELALYEEDAGIEAADREAIPSYREETAAFFPSEQNGLPYDVEIRTLRFDEPEHDLPIPTPPAPAAENYRILDDHLGEGGAKLKFQRNIQAIATLKQIESENRQATPEEQHILAQYVGWGGLADVFDPDKPAWAAEYSELKGILTDAEYTAARGSTLNAHYTSPTVIRAIYEAVGNMGFRTGNILEPSMGVGNFFGMLPEEMRGSRLYGVELDSITGRIARQLYPKANITVAGFETTNRSDFFDLAVGNVPFGSYRVDDRAYNKLGFSIHNYFFAKALDQVRPGGVIAFVTSHYTMDAKDPTVRKYLAQRADLLGAIRLPNNAFKANAGTEVVSDIIFLQKRDHLIDTEPEWVFTGQNEDGHAVNSYFLLHPDMVLGRQTSEHGMYGKDEYTVAPLPDAELSDQLHEAIRHIHGTYEEAELPELGEGEEVSETLPADPSIKNYSYAVVNGEVYYRENSIMVKPDLNATAKERVKGMVRLRDCVRELIDLQMDEYTPENAITEKQTELNRLYDAYTARFGLINDRSNRLAFADDDSYYLLCSLEVLDENGELERKADFFTKRTIKQQHSVDHVDTAVEALGVSIGERACVDLPFMAALMGGQDKIPQIVEDLRGVIFKDPATGPFDYAEDGEHWNKGWQTADEYLSGNVRQKLRWAKRAGELYPEFRINEEALRKAQPKDLDASEIEVRIGTTWIDKEYYQQFMYETFDTPFYLQSRVRINYSPYTAEWQIEGKSKLPYNNIAAYVTYGTARANAYRLLEDALNLRDTRIYDTVQDPDGKERRVLNAKETTLAAQKQQLIKDAFKDWIWRDPERRAALVKQYNEEMNSTRPREYDGSHIVFSGMNPEITLRPHQRDAIAHVLYGGNTLLAHEVGAGKTFEMVAAAMESKRLGLCSKSFFVVPNHLTDQWAAEFLRLYPSANILVTTKKDFQKQNRKKFCSRITTGNYDAIIIGHSQFEKIPISPERQIRLIEEQIEEITNGIEEVKESNGERFTIKELERTKKGLEARLKKLLEGGGKDDVVSFEQLGVDRMFVDESDNYKNLFLYTKMRNVAGLTTTDAQKSSDMFAKCRYMDELTEGRGIVFATGTPVSNSMTELYTIQRYLQYDRLQELGMGHFDCWASRFGETVTALELAPEGTGYRARTRFAKFFN